ncbi:MAG TPA: polysaccharide biosynthesis/export family protein [Vicinamibacterales bacterium]|nr:polysaccharide biosynthesis/export family protein [Vicinamibacterales bacterium]
MTRKLLLLPLIWTVTAGVAAAQDAPKATNTEAAIVRATASTADYQIGPEDVLDISVWKNAELTRRVSVRPDGKISLPLVNDIQASGLTPSELRQQLTARLSEFVPTPEVAVVVQEVQSLKVSVVGAVKTPGRFTLRSAATVLECIALAQGLTEFANRERIVVLRQNGNTTQRIPFNYRKVADGSEQDNFLVKPGDIIVVP